MIEIKDISKMYKLGLISSKTIQDDIKNIYYNITGKKNPDLEIIETNTRDEKGGDYVWALKDINFKVKKGEVVGIIGKNGAGKSTLLKLLSKVTKPTTGYIKTKGKLASLLEVGTGFHNELSGRENIFLNGAILGMSKSEITSKLDEIIEFSGCKRYIDTPVKRYSSGMHVRLAFAVAAHLDPDVLIVDEVLAVGDAEFQRKAIGKMKEVSTGGGRTVLFVSHNMASIKNLCSRAILLENGMVSFDGTVDKAIELYKSQNNKDLKKEFNFSSKFVNEYIKLDNFNLSPIKGNYISINSGIEFNFLFQNLQKVLNIDITYEISNMEDLVIFHTGHVLEETAKKKTEALRVKAQIPHLNLNTGGYKLKVIFGQNQSKLLLSTDYFLEFEVQNEALGSNSKVLPGVVRPEIKNSIKIIS
jgi:lipopolysaccharide transport system ATP-binding protein